MECTRPLKGWVQRPEKGGAAFTLKWSEGYHDLKVQVSCGQCIACRLAKVADWATRIKHEIQMHDQSSFVTLTYNDENFPRNGSLEKDEAQKFIKRLRKSLQPNKVRYFLSGEYGSMFERPHYHAIIFGYFPKDTKPAQIKSKYQYFESESLQKLWGKGFVTVGEANFKTAAYTAKYVTKKAIGTKDHIHYHFRASEFAIMSRRPGIGLTWYEKYKDQTQRCENIVMNGKEIGIPDYYKKKWKMESPESYRNYQINNYRSRSSEERLEVTERWLTKNNEFFKSDVF